MQPYVLAPSELSHERAAWLWLPRVTQMLMALLRNSAGGPQSTVPNPNRAFAEVFKEGKAVLTAIYLPSQSTGFVLVYLTLQWSERVYGEGAGHLHFNVFFFCFFFFTRTQSSCLPRDPQFSVYFKTPLLVKARTVWLLPQCSGSTNLEQESYRLQKHWCNYPLDITIPAFSQVKYRILHV